MKRIRAATVSRAFRRFLRAVREWPGWFTAAAGAVLCVLGWYGVSGETLAARQLPYLASATVPGAALIVAGAVLVAARSQGRGGAGELTDRRVELLYGLLVEPSDEQSDEQQAEGGQRREGGDRSGAGGADLLAVPEGTLYHRRGCLLVTGKDRAEPVDEAAVHERGLAPCPVCEPPSPPAAGQD